MLETMYSVDGQWYFFGCMMQLRDVSTGATGTTSVAPRFSDNLTLSQLRGGGQILPTIAEVAPRMFPRLRTCNYTLRHMEIFSTMWHWWHDIMDLKTTSLTVHTVFLFLLTLNTVHGPNFFVAKHFFTWIIWYACCTCYHTWTPWCWTSVEIFSVRISGVGII